MKTLERRARQTIRLLNFFYLGVTIAAFSIFGMNYYILSELIEVMFFVVPAMDICIEELFRRAFHNG